MKLGFGGDNKAQTYVPCRSVYLSGVAISGRSGNFSPLYPQTSKKREDTGEENSRIALRFLEWFENTQSDKVQNFEFIEAAESRVSLPTKTPIQIPMKSNGHHYDVTC